MPDDVVEQHLSLVIAMIREGAKPMTVTETVAKEMKDRYRRDFSDPDNIKKWDHDWPKLTILSVIVGQLGEFFTRIWYTVRGRTVPTEVDSHAMWLAGYFVSRTICPPPGSVIILGDHCENYPAANSWLVRFLVWGLRVVVRLLIRLAGLLVTEGPLAVAPPPK